MQKGSIKALEDKAGLDPLLNIFLDLISYDTKADIKGNNVPSSIGQLRLGAYLLSRINALGFECSQTKSGVIITRVKASKGCENAKRLCLLAHLDTATDASGANIKASLVTNYEGNGIELENGLILDDKISEELNEHIGDDIVVTDGTTLLGADDKAGVAVLMRLLNELSVNQSIKHGPLTIIFSVDEEIGKSCDYLDVNEIACDFAATIDGTNLGELDVATFNAYGAEIVFKGITIHTSVAYKKMINSLTVAAEFINMLPKDEAPETTKGLEGFYHVNDMEGTVAQTKLLMILRDFDKDKLMKRVAFVKELCQKLNDKYGREVAVPYFVEQYKNMAEGLKGHEEILDLCRDAFKDAGVLVRENYVRGGTDGSNLSNRGLPCPNIFTGGLNCHGPYECLPVKALNKAYDVTLALVKRVSQTTRG